ncbi:centrosomal protein of 164 kDa isoform X1 [Diorhabda sublineata]|uniref:centrosomal protein of 164 kDa isoform X1 n=1 Tax=Diorhabda sublineata TaxID=1163346 RepID=UPI0024E128A8|nr:centrosomal protein of 164 kDa isoform X1 [Diorhabda sublineata]
MSIICEEIFDEISHPSEEEVKEYALRIGIDPVSEPQLLPLAAEGLMKALPAGWKPCYDDKSKCYYYYNNLTKKTQWEHPLDNIYRGLVKKARTESQSLSLQDNREDATYVTDDILSLEEPVSNTPSKKLDPLPIVTKKRLSPIKLSPNASPKKDFKLFKQKSEDSTTGPKKLSLGFSSLDDEKDSVFDRHPRNMDLKVAGGGSMFLKSNTMKKNIDTGTSPVNTKTENNQGVIDQGDSQQPRSILREKNIMEHSKSLEFDRLAIMDKSEKDEEDKKSVRFNLENNTDIGITFSDKSSSEEEYANSDKHKLDDVINVKLTPIKSRFSVHPVLEPIKTNNTLKLIKPNPKDCIKPKLTLSKVSDSDDETHSLEKEGLENVNIFESDNSDSISERIAKSTKQLEAKAEKKVELLKQTIWEEKNKEMMKFKEDLETSHKRELKRILEDEKSKQDIILEEEIEKLKLALNLEHQTAIEDEKNKIEDKLRYLKTELDNNIVIEEDKMKEKFEIKKEELEKYYEEKLADVEKELAEKVEKSRDELIFNHNADVDQLKQNHTIIIDELKRQFDAEEQVLRKTHQAKMSELRSKFQAELEQDKNRSTTDEKLRCEKRLLEDKYRCLKEKYIKLKTEVRMTMEKRSKRKEQSTTTNTTGSETEQSHSNNKEKKVVDKPPTPKHTKNSTAEEPRPKSETRNATQVLIHDIDTSVSDNCYHSDDKTNQNDSSDSTNPGRSRKKIFSRLKSSSTSRINNNTKVRKPQRSCSPVENLRRQLQKLEDLEDQFPENAQADTYHLRYPFSDGQKFEGSSELEFFRHRIHLERDSIKRAKESLRSQKSLFQQRQKELKLKHGSMARHTLQQLCQEEKELTDMEVNLHRTRSLLGEKVIRLRHLEQSLQRANMQNDQNHEDATLSDISSHSASSGISSTEFATADYVAKGILNKEKFQESSEIIQSLENLNSEIREIWDVLRKQQQQTNIQQVIPPLVYPDLGWPVLAGSATNVQPAPPSIPTLADRLHNYRQHLALANAQSTVVTHATQGATTTLVERTRNLRHWLKTTSMEAGGSDTNAQQATL